MPLSATDQKNQDDLKNELQSESKPSKLERLAAALIGKLLGVSIAIAKSGFQHGGDAGPAGRQGRRFRLECKKYSDTTSLSDRELLGEIDHALSHDAALEAWFLIATRSVPEQLEQNLTQKGEGLGVPVIIIDWKNNELASLAALCAFDPDLVEVEFSKKAGAYARALQPVSSNAIDMLRRDLQSWCLGFEALRTQSHNKLKNIWNSPKTSNADIGQDAAGGAHSKRIQRSAVHRALNNWWAGAANPDSPAAVIGWDGVGKTWATIDWLVEHLNVLPIVLIVPSSATATLSGISEKKIKRFLADRLYEISGVRDTDHWMHRLDYLLKRPANEGQVLTIYFDGVNQESSVPWLQLFKTLQGESFSSKVRVIASTRKHHFEEKLSRLRGLISPAIPIEVDVYDAAPGGELDQMLKFEGLTQADLHSDLIELARTPRLFTLVVRFRDRLIDAGHVTVHRLLWEYGRDTLGVRAGKSFSENEWRTWLKEIAIQHLDGIKTFSIKSLGEMASRPDLSESEVYARLSDIIDGRFARPDTSGSLQLTPTVIAHALGVALLSKLEAVESPSFTSLNIELTQWLDPIAGLDQRAEILRAAVSILVEQNSKAPHLAGVLVTAWLQTQNVTDNHRKELAILAPELTDALFVAIEQSEDHTHASARLWSVNALRTIPRDNESACSEIFARVHQWFSIVSRDVDHRPDSNAEMEKNRTERFISRIGTDFAGSVSIIGNKLELVDRDNGILQATAPSIIEGFPLAKALPIFENAAVNLAIRNRCEGWDSLKWLCLFNETDPDETTTALRIRANCIQHLTPEPGVNQDIPARIAALLLCLTGQEQDDDTAAAINPHIDNWFSYEKDYLQNPSRSYFALERRHADVALIDSGMAVISRVQRTEELWLDPNFQPPPSFVSEIRTVANHFEVDKLSNQGSYTIEDHNFEKLERAIARCAPDLLADMMCRKIQGIATCPAESRYWRGIHVIDYFILSDATEAAAARKVRISGGIDPDEKRDQHVVNKLLMLEIRQQEAQSQFNTLIDANLEFILRDMAEILRPPSSDDIDALITKYSRSSSKKKNDLLLLLSLHPVKLSDSAWSWIVDFAQQSNHEYCHIAYRTLSLSDAARFGRSLVADKWQWSADKHYWVNHYGTGALIQATLAVPFDQIAPRLAPWRLLEAARLRGNDATEVRLAAEIVGHILLASNNTAPDLGADLTIRLRDGEYHPLHFSVSLRESQKEANNPFAALSIDIDTRIKALNLAAETAASRIDEARSAGASLYLSHLDQADFAAALQFAPDMVDRWLEGSSERTVDFRRRVHLAEGAFHALCEALLSHDSKRGVNLWHALRATAIATYIGSAGIDDSLHMIFRAPDTPAIIKLREELLDPEHSDTDQALLNTAIAATFNGKTDWLNTMIDSDLKSALTWKRRRGEVLSGFAANNALPIARAWPDGEIKTNHAALDMRAARFKWIEACAHHWWKTYLKAQNPVDAFAAWILFLNAADPRAWIWMQQEIQLANDSSDFFKLKLSHAQLNLPKLEQAMKKRIDKLDKKLFDQDICLGIGPWGKGSDLSD